jgi:hypothetical protein
MESYLETMTRARKDKIQPKVLAEWPLPAAATLGSSVRAKGILLEIRARLPASMRKALDIEAGVLVLHMPEGAATEFETASSLVIGALQGIDALPVIPREIEDILTITTTERHRWLKDGRLPSAGTRTVKLRGRARKITFHVFDPRLVDDLLEGDQIDAWREDDAETARENRRRAAWKTRLARARKADQSGQFDESSQDRPRLAGWEEFAREGLLR